MTLIITYGKGETKGLLFVKDMCIHVFATHQLNFKLDKKKWDLKHKKKICGFI